VEKVIEVLKIEREESIDIFRPCACFVMIEEHAWFMLEC
jgi:hypothetical protein